MGVDALGVKWRHLHLANTKSGGLLIAASGRCVWDDVMQASVVADQFDVMVVNDMIMHWPYPFQHAYSNDHVWLHKWLAARRPQHQKIDGLYDIHTCAVGTGKEHIWPWPGHGTSSLNAVYTGLALGYERIVLCGAPLDSSGHYFDPPWVQSNFHNEVKDRDGLPRYWENAARKVFNGKVRSMSGRTQALLGGIDDWMPIPA